MSKVNEAKVQVVEEIAAKIKASKSLVLVDYNKLTVAEVTELRNKFREKNCEYKVYKNTLIRKALNAQGFNQFDADLNGPTAVAFGADETTAAKIFVDATKNLDEKIKLKSALVDGTYVNAAGVKALASIPAREQLIAGLAGALTGVVRGLAVALNAVAEKQGEQA